MKKFEGCDYNHELFEEQLEQGLLKFDVSHTYGIDCSIASCCGCAFDGTACALTQFSMDFPKEYPEYFI